MNNNDIQYLNEIGCGFWKSQVLFVAVEMGLFTLLKDRGESCKEISRKLKINSRATEMLLNALVSLKFLNKVGSIYKNTTMSSRYLVKGGPFYQGDRAHHFHNLWDCWSRLDEAIKTGKPTAYDDAKDEIDENRLREFISAMHNIGSVQVEEICEKLNIKKYNRLLDLGGGQGTYAVRFARENPEMRAVVFDLPDVVKLAGEYIGKSGQKRRVTTQGGDCLKDDFGKELYDIVFVSNLLHIYNPGENIKILKKCWKSIIKKGIVVIQEFALNPSKTQPLFSTLFSLNMLVGTRNGSSYTGTEMKEWLRKAGFRNIKKINLNLDSGLIIGCK